MFALYYVQSHCVHRKCASIMLTYYYCFTVGSTCDITIINILLSPNTRQVQQPSILGEWTLRTGRRFGGRPTNAAAFNHRHKSLDCFFIIFFRLLSSSSSASSFLWSLETHTWSCRTANMLNFYLLPLTIFITCGE